jgi:hypothetical protein
LIMHRHSMQATSKKFRLVETAGTTSSSIIRLCFSHSRRARFNMASTLAIGTGIAVAAFLVRQLSVGFHAMRWRIRWLS